jgi:hypothetical protein
VAWAQHGRASVDRRAEPAINRLAIAVTSKRPSSRGYPDDMRALGNDCVEVSARGRLVAVPSGPKPARDVAIDAVLVGERLDTVQALGLAPAADAGHA